MSPGCFHNILVCHVLTSFGTSTQESQHIINIFIMQEVYAAQRAEIITNLFTSVTEGTSFAGKCGWKKQKASTRNNDQGNWIR